MNKNAIKKFAIEARRKLIDSVTDKAGMLGITEKSCSEPIAKGVDFEVYQTVAGTEVTLNKRQCEQRRRLVSQIHSRGFEAVVEEVAYTWFNRICAIRFMEVNDYLPNRVRVLSSEKEGKMEPDLVTLAPDVDLDLTVQEKEEIINWKLSGTSEDTDKLYCKLFLKQCHQLHDILPGLFEADSDYMEQLFGISYTNKDDVIYMLVNPDTGIPENDFNVSAVDEEGNPTGQVEIIGWLYQYYNTELKDDTFAKLKKNIKITKERIPAATQLFTPDWIVRYMVENSVGRIWIEHLRAVDPSTDEKTTAERFGWKYYLPEAEQEESVNVKLAEIRSNYKDLKPTDITCIDPCMGSGHILIAMFDVLMDIYECAGYDKREAAFEIVEHNIHGLDIDQRAYQLAYFSVMMKGRGYNRRFLRGRDGKPEPKVYAIVESNEINRNHLQFFGLSMEVKDREKAEQQIRYLLDTFVDAREYGSILNVEECDWKLLKKFVSDLQIEGQFSLDSIGSDKTQGQLGRLIWVAENLGKKYDAVVTNPPYMGGSMNKKLYIYLEKNYKETKSDMYSVFIERANLFAKKFAKISLVTPETWMFLESYAALRASLLCGYRFVSLCHFGTGAFDSGFGTVAFCYEKGRNYSNGLYINLKDVKDKEKGIRFEMSKVVNSSLFDRLPGNIIAYWCSDKMASVFNNKKIGDCFELESGIVTGDNVSYLRLWYEVSEYNSALFNVRPSDINDSKYKWFKCNKGGGYRKWYGCYDYVVNIGNDAADIKANIDASIYRLRKKENYFLEGINWPLIGVDKFSAKYTPNDVINNKAANSIHFRTQIDKNLFAYLNSKVYNALLLMINPTVNYPLANIASSPYVEIAEDLSNIVDECVDISKKDWDSYETSIDFKYHFLCTGKKDVLQTIYSDWTTLCNSRFSRLTELEEEINKKYIQVCGLEQEINYMVEKNDIGLRVPNLKDDIKSLVSYAVGCMFGRYSLDEEGLILAGQPLKSHFYMTTAPVAGTGFAGSPGPYLPTGECYYKDEHGEVKKCSYNPDTDNIIPITDEDYFSDDIVSRFVTFVKTVYGEETLEENLQFIADALGNKGETSREVLRNYFLRDFYADHLKVYQKRPIYWLFDSGKQNGFKALIYMHRYDADTVGRVRTDYLHRAQEYVRTAMQSAQYTIDNATSVSEKSKATKAVTKYTKQLAEMKIYDEAIAHIANQRIEIDLDDGVKVNYAKFQGVEVAQEGKKALKVDLLAKLK